MSPLIASSNVKGFSLAGSAFGMISYERANAIIGNASGGRR